MTDGLERRVLVTLYRVWEWSAEIDYDLYDYHYRNGKTAGHGIYRTEKRAQRVQRKRIGELVKEGWKISQEGPDQLYRSMNAEGAPDYDCRVAVEKFSVDEKSITRGRGGRYYKGELIH